MRTDFDTPDAPDGDLITSALQPDPSLVNGDVTADPESLEDICDEILSDITGDDGDDSGDGE